MGCLRSIRLAFAYVSASHRCRGIGDRCPDTLDAPFLDGTHGKAALATAIPPCKRNATVRAVEGNLSGFCVGNHALALVRLTHDRRFVVVFLFFVVLVVFIRILGRHSVADDRDGTSVDQTGAKLLGDESDHVAYPIAQAAVANFSNAELFSRLRSRSPEAACLRIDDADVMHLLKVMLKASGKKGVPQGGVISPLLSNLYLNEVDKMLERAREVTRNGKYTYIEYARFADDLVILIDAYKRHDWLVVAVDKRLREEFGKLQVEINDEKSRTVDLERGECFGFLGFEFRYLRGLSGAMRPHYTPKLKKRTALVWTLKEVFRRHRSQPIERVINLINPMLRGWVNYFAVGHSSECFSFIKDWVEKKVRRHLAHAQKRKGFGWGRWNRLWLYDTLGLFNAYRVRRNGPKVAPAG